MERGEQIRIQQMKQNLQRSSRKPEYKLYKLKKIKSRDFRREDLKDNLAIISAQNTIVVVGIWFLKDQTCVLELCLRLK